MSAASIDSTEYRPGPKEIIVQEWSESEDSSSTTSSEEEEKKEFSRAELPPEYWHIQKLIKYLKSGNQTATVIALCCLYDHDLDVEFNQLAVQDVGGLDILINLLETSHLKCKLGSLRILIKLSQNESIRKCLTYLGAIPLLVNNLSDPAKDLQIMVAETIHNIAKVRKARRHIRKCGGIPKLIDLLDVCESCLLTPFDELGSDDKEYVNITAAAARALWTVSQCRKNVQEMMTSGAVPLLATLLKSIHFNVVVPIAGTISLCACDTNFRLAVRTENMVQGVVRHLSSQEYQSLQTFCALTIFKCSEDSNIRDMVRQSGGLDPLVNMANDPEVRANGELLSAVTGALWKTAISGENVERYDQLRTIDVLATILEESDEDLVLSYVVGALYECLKFERNREVLRRSGAMPHLINLLNLTHPLLLTNLPLLLRECAKDSESMRIIEELDGVRLVWSLLKNPFPQVQANAASCLVPCVRYATNSGEMVRSFVGSLELIVQLLRSQDNFVLGCVCEVVSEVAQDRENLAILSDLGVIPLLVDLLQTEDVEVRKHVAAAVAYCSTWGANSKHFGRLGAIPFLVRYMADKDINVHRSAALALYHLSINPFNCIMMHECGIVPFFLRGVASTDEKLQEASAGCLNNIRKLALDEHTLHLISS